MDTDLSTIYGENGGWNMGAVPIGTIVYKPYTPAKCGKVIEDLGNIIVYPNLDAPKGRALIIQWKNGSKTKEDARNLNSFEALVEDHKRKYEKHSKVLEEMKKL